jgi:hypothetical protein|tara:strand:+ start:1134 stop:1418 length:285 start_codon:yes stop_codon:yes gene_type:complete
MKRKLTTEEIIKYFNTEKGLAWGMDSVIKSLALSSSVGFDLDCTNGSYTVTRWESDLPKPTPEEIKQEYERHKTIAECLEIFKKQNGKTEDRII